MSLTVHASLPLLARLRPTWPHKSTSNGRATCPPGYPGARQKAHRPRQSGRSTRSVIPMEFQESLGCVTLALALGLIPPAPAWILAGQESQVFRVPSKDGTLIAVECAGSGPSLV